MIDFVCDSEKCVQCGLCVSDCLVGCLEMTEDGVRTVQGREEHCIKCQHCLSICPVGAVSVLGCAPEGSLELGRGLPDLASLELLVRGRRSTRKYAPEPVDSELLDRLLDDLAYAPTGVNARQLLFTLVEDPAVMETLRRDSAEGFVQALEPGGCLAGHPYLSRYLPALKTGKDIIYRGAPHVLVITAADSAPCAPVDPVIAMSYFELLANAAGLGTVWCGFGHRAIFTVMPGYAQKLGIPEDHSNGYVMAFGQPDVRYHRTVQREQASVNRVRSLS